MQKQSSRKKSTQRPRRRRTRTITGVPDIALELTKAHFRGQEIIGLSTLPSGIEPLVEIGAGEDCNYITVRYDEGDRTAIDRTALKLTQDGDTIILARERIPALIHALLELE